MIPEPHYTSVTVLPAAVPGAAIPGPASMVEIMDPRVTTFEAEESAWTEVDTIHQVKIMIWAEIHQAILS